MSNIRDNSKSLLLSSSAGARRGQDRVPRPARIGKRDTKMTWCPQPTGMVITGSCWVFSPSASDSRWTIKAKIILTDSLCRRSRTSGHGGEHVWRHHLVTATLCFIDSNVRDRTEVGRCRRGAAFGNIARRHLNAVCHIDQDPHDRAGHHSDLTRLTPPRSKYDPKMLALRR
jgi:hypothetical protein